MGQGNPFNPFPLDRGVEDSIIDAEDSDDEQNDLHSLYFSAHLPTDRRLSQDLEQARGLLAEARYSEGLPLVDRVMAAGEDTFNVTQTSPRRAVVTSLKSVAKELLAKLPPAGVTALELETGIVARRRLNAAARAGDLPAIAAVASRYPLTEAAADALLIVAQAHVDSGDYAGAARLYEELLGWPTAAEKHGVLLAVRAAICWANQGDSANLDQVLAQLASANSSKERDQLHTILRQQDFSEWSKKLRELAVANAGPEDQSDWFIEGGDTNRNPHCTGGAPHVWPAWQARTVKEANVAARLLEREEWQQGRGASWTIIASPLAVGDLVIARTPHNLIALDWRSGKRVWETRNDNPPDVENVLSINERQGGQATGVTLGDTEQRTWLDAVFGALSCDGQRVYAIRNLESLKSWNVSPWGVPAFGRMADDTGEIGNALSAFDLHSEGKLVWQIDGAADHGENAGLFFLGPPLAVGDSLYAIAELRNSIHLVVINATDGKVLWKQPLANLERSVRLDVGRRLAGATPSYGNGLIVCPTGAGSVVAVDPINRSLQWAYRFEVEESAATRKSPDWHHRWSAYQPSLTGAWSRNRCVISDGRAVVTAPESDDLHCVDLATGKKVWTLDRDEGRFVAGVTQGQVLVVASSRLYAYDLSSGKKSWYVSFPGGATSAGLGIVTEGQLLQPLTGGQLGVVDVATGTLAKTLTIRQNQPLGNLTYHRGTLLSQSPVSLIRFDQVEQLRKEASVGLAQTPPDPDALRIQGEIAWSEGDLGRAIDSFGQALESEPEDALIRLRMSEALLAGLRADYSRYHEQSRLLDTLVEDRAQQLDLLRLHVDGSLAANDPAASFEYALALYDIDGETMVTPVDGHLVQSERWFAARIARIWSNADDRLRQEITASVESLHQAAKVDASPTPLSRLVRYFGGIPAGRGPRVELAGTLVHSKRLAEAELLLLRTDLEEQSSQFGDAPPKQRELFSCLCGSDHPHRPSTTDHPSLFACKSPITLSEWPDGKVLVEHRRVSTPRSSSPSSSRSRSRGPQQTRLEPESIGLPLGGPFAIAIADGGSELIGWNDLGELSQRISLEIESLQQSSELTNLKTIRFGHFCFIGTGREVAAVDLRFQSGNGPGPLLWTSRPERARYNRLGQAQLQIQMRGGRFFDPRLARGNLASGALQRDARVGQLCNASPQGVVLRDKDQVRCFDPVDGELLWQRDEMPTSGEAFGDWRHLFLVKSGKEEGIVLSMIDGSTIGSWSRPTGKWVATVAGNIVTSRYRGGRQEIKVIRAKTGEPLVEQTYQGGGRLARVDAETFIFVEKSGKIELIDAEQGVLRFDQQLLPVSKLASVHVLPAGDTLFLVTNTRSQAQHNTDGNQAIADVPVVTGHVYALDASTGTPLWERPATVRGQGLALLQAPATPVLLFVSQLEERKSSRSNKTTRLLCLDKRTGRSLVRENKMTRLDSPEIAMRVDQGSQPTVTVDLRHTHLVLRFTESPRPPEPIALAEVEEGNKSVSAGWFGLMRRAMSGSTEQQFGTVPVDEDD